MTPAQRQRADVLHVMASNKLWLAEVRAGALRRAAELNRLRDQVRSGRVRAALLVAARSVLVVAEAAEAALSDTAGDEGLLDGEVR